MSESNIPTLDARTLRELAETADGNRDVSCEIVEIDLGGQLHYTVMPTAEAKAKVKVGRESARIVFHVQTSSTVKKRPEPTVSISVGGTSVPPDALRGADAFFWSESSVEKFLWPYYESLRIWTPDYAKNLKKAYYQPDICGVAHFSPSHGVAIPDPNRARLVVSGASLVGPQLMTVEEYTAYRTELRTKDAGEAKR